MKSALCLVAFCFVAATAGAVCDETLVHGSWEWVSTEFQGNVIETPASAGYTVQVEYWPDHSYFEFRDEQLIGLGTWSYNCWIAEWNEDYYIVQEVRVEDGDWLRWDTPEPGVMLFSADPFILPQDVVHRYHSRERVSIASRTWGAIKAIYR